MINITCENNEYNKYKKLEFQFLLINILNKDNFICDINYV